jgi:endothelin-converting enzyme/putative endopeptidase
MSTFKLLLFFALFGALSSAQAPQTTSSESGLDLAGVDKTADPCQDFYQYACGNWLKTHPIPPDESSWGTFNQLFDRNQAALRQILDDSAAHQDRSPIDQKIGGFYESCADEGTIEKRGTEPLKPELDRLTAISQKEQLLDEVARLHNQQVYVFFTFGATSDPKNASMNIGEVDQGGLGLPEKDFYFRTDPRSVEVRKKYVAHIGKMFELIGISPQEASAKAAKVMAIETELAKNSLDVTSRRNPQLLVHEMTKEQLAALSPQFNFNRFFTGLSTPEFTKLNVTVPDFIKGFNALLQTQALGDLKDYIVWHYVNASSRLLPKSFVEETFDFFGRTLAGTKELRPRWKRCVSATDEELGEALGQKFVEKTFGQEGKARTLALVDEIEKQMAIDINSLTWMSPETKKAALVKLHAVTNKIGYPDKWRDYSPISIAKEDYFGNWYRSNEFESKRQRNKIGKPVDKQEWAMTPPTVNAYYNPSENNINFPAGILQPPFYSNKASDAVNYGAVGVVVGHELTHGFDDQGRQFDAQGNLKDWWTKEDQEKFQKLAECFVNEYGGFSPAPGLELNGKLTLGENTADNGGIRLAYLALMDDLAKRTIPVTSKADGYTQSQQFFIGYGQLWCENVRPERARLWAQTDPHSPGKFRTNGVVSNLPAFSEAFGCKAGDKMFAAKGCRVW